MRLVRMLVKTAIGLVLLIVVVVVGVVGYLIATSRGQEARQNFRITVEDDRGRQLATAVWEMHGVKRHPTVSEGFSGQAFVIEHPTLGKLYVLDAANKGDGRHSTNYLGAGGIKIAYEKIGILPTNHDLKCAILLVDCPSYISEMKRARAPVVQMQTPAVVRFRNEADPTSIEMLTTQFTNGANDVELRFFVQPTSDPVTCGIEKHLPWLATYESDVPFVAGDKWNKETGYGGYRDRQGWWISLPGPTNSALDRIRKSSFLYRGCAGK